MGQGTGLGSMGSNMLCRHVHTGPRRVQRLGSIVSYCTCPILFFGNYWHFCVTSNGNKLEIGANQKNLNTNLDVIRAH